MMASRRAAFTQSDLAKVLKAFRDAGQPMPQIVIEPQRITATPINGTTQATDPNPWDRP
jgi:enhancing lycopene biosynthesis protein 2